jgi:hypothetical protein
VTDAAPPQPVAVLRDPVVCRATADGLTLRGAAADSTEETLILTLVGAVPGGFPGRLGATAVHVLEDGRYRIASASGEWVVEATSLHLHRDVGVAFRRAIPPRRVPLMKRLFWRVVMALAGNPAGKRLLLALRRQ